LTTSTSIEAAVWWFISLESLCRIQLLADAAAGGRGIETIKAGEKEAEFTYKAVGKYTFIIPLLSSHVHPLGCSRLLTRVLFLCRLRYGWLGPGATLL
jgi:hypothetical protein